MSDLLSVVLPVGLLLFGLCGGAWCYRHEKKVWNSGVCRENGEPWVLFDRDSQGGRGYVAGDIRCWISWSVDR